MRKTAFGLILFLVFKVAISQAQNKYPDIIGKLGSEGLLNRLPVNVMPVQACWFWGEEEFFPNGYKAFIDQASLHSPYNLVSASIRIKNKEVTSVVVHDQLKLAAEYAASRGISLIADLDVRVARRAFESKYPDELQQMLLLREVRLSGDGDVETVIASKDLRDHYTGSTMHYEPLYGTLLKVYSYAGGSDGIDPATLRDITHNCVVEFSSKDSVRVRIPAREKNASIRACVMVAFTHLTPDVFAPHIMAFQRDIIRQYADVPLAGVFKDEWGFPPCFDGSPTKDQFWYSRYRAQAYAERTGGRDLLIDCLLMHLGIKGQERERQRAINHFMEMSWKRNAELEEGFYLAVKEVFGPDAAVTTHPTWYPYPDLREHMKNGLDWWAVKRDWAQTDEVTPFAVRTALAKKWGSSIWYNMYYSNDRTDYEQAVWSYALAGGRINYHPIYPSEVRGIDNHLALLRGDLMLAESRVRLLNYISQSPLDCPVAVVFGHACTMNWQGPAYDDVGMDLVNRLWCEGIPVDLIPSSEIENNNLVIDKDGFIRYGNQKYAAAILYHPEFEKNTTAEFFNQAVHGPTRLFRIGDWTKDFDARDIGGEIKLPGSMMVFTEIEGVLSAIRKILQEQKIDLQTASVVNTTESFGHIQVNPPTKGFCRLLDGTVIQVAGTDNPSGDPILSTRLIKGYKVSFDAIGVAAVRLGQNGQVMALVAGGLKSFHAGSLKIDLRERADIALWINGSGVWEGVIQGWDGEIPEQLQNITKNWARLSYPIGFMDYE